MRHLSRIVKWIRQNDLAGLVDFSTDQRMTEVVEGDDVRPGTYDVVTGTWAGQPIIEEYLPLGTADMLIYRLRAEGVIQ